MAGVCFGILGFIMCYIYDFNSVLWRRRLFHSFFLLGNISIALSTAAVFAADAAKADKTAAFYSFCFLAVIFLGLLIYTLFFALPFDTTYVRQSKAARKVYTKGMYALCRHPAVLWFAFLYLNLFLAAGTLRMFAVFIVNTFMDVLYVILQERYIFHKTFSDYEAYTKTTPFLIPDKKSIRQCLKKLG